MVRENNWISSDPLLNRLQIPKPSAFLKMPIILFGIAAVSLFAIVGILLLTVDEKCAYLQSSLNTCMPLMKDFALRFFPKEILKLFSILVTTVVFLALTERISTKISLFALVFKSLAVVALSSFLFALYTVVNDTSIPYGATKAPPLPVRTGFLATVIAAITIFWLVFIPYSSLRQRKLLSRRKGADSVIV
ncbi:hypothetical protein [Rhizobium sp. CCGE 510]|uniref:hypothetical protein n=1 Tax=Rhizobium sp. CCGE 510 TaxID=1132836 RepID=UPI0012F62995|nr:hypothetical protein [Rhizobium sp. CCGE 510]